MPISLEHHLAIATRDYAALSRVAVRRERFLDARDWTALEKQVAREVSMTDDLINEDLASLWPYIDHLGHWSADVRSAARNCAPLRDKRLSIMRRNDR